jgi:hypothetical protein
VVNSRKHTDGRHLSSSGYVVVTRLGVPEELRAAFDIAARGRSKLFEHHVIMAARLGRPLRRDETVHHCNGKRADNRPSNLRLYKRGEHHPGYGDFYQEWQEAEAKLAGLTH